MTDSPFRTQLTALPLSLTRDTHSRGWLGQIEDTTGLTYLNARYYDPALGRFLSPDPLMNPGDPPTLDPYRYADNNPVTYTDASGLRPQCGATAACRKYDSAPITKSAHGKYVLRTKASKAPNSPTTVTQAPPSVQGKSKAPQGPNVAVQSLASVGSFFWALGSDAANTVKGTVEFSLIGEGVKAAASPSFWWQQKQTQWHILEYGWSSIANDPASLKAVPGHLWDAASAPTRDCWNAEDYGCSVGHVTFAVLALLAPGAKGGGTAAAKTARAESIVAESRTYVDLTRGGSIRNVGTNATHTEFAETLTQNGWASRVSSDGAVQIFEQNGARYVLRQQAGSYSGWSADFTPAGSAGTTLKLRLGFE